MDGYGYVWMVLMVIALRGMLAHLKKTLLRAYWLALWPLSTMCWNFPPFHGPTIFLNFSLRISELIFLVFVKLDFSVTPMKSSSSLSEGLPGT